MFSRFTTLPDVSCGILTSYQSQSPAHIILGTSSFFVFSHRFWSCSQRFKRHKNEPQIRNGLESPDYDEMLAAYLTLVDQHCLHLIPVAASDSVPAIPGHIDNRAVYNSWAGEYVVDYEAWVNNFPTRP